MINVPVDLTAEQKTVLAFLSIRQLLIIGPPAFFTIIQLIFINYPFVHGWTEAGLKITIFLLVNGITAALAFIPITKYDCYLNEFVVRRIRFLLSTKTYTN